MPTYTYKCPSCGHEYEKIQKMTDNSRAKCPQCQARGVRVITGGGGLIFKGSGFYITDYKRAPEKEKAGTTGDGKAKTEERKTEKGKTEKGKTENVKAENTEPKPKTGDQS